MSFSHPAENPREGVVLYSGAAGIGLIHEKDPDSGTSTIWTCHFLDFNDARDAHVKPGEVKDEDIEQFINPERGDVVYFCGQDEAERIPDRKEDWEAYWDQRTIIRDNHAYFIEYKSEGDAKEEKAKDYRTLNENYRWVDDSDLAGSSYQENLASILRKTTKPTVFDSIQPDETVEISEEIKDWDSDDRVVPESVFFLDCKFPNPFFLTNLEYENSLFFCGSTFGSLMSLKKSDVQNDLHLESCDFQGAGGASFRRVDCRNLYLDYGVQGPDGMVWLNEIDVENDLSISGHFPGDIQLLGDQDVRTDRHFGCVGSLLIGHEPYKSQRIQKTAIENGLEIAGDNEESDDAQGDLSVTGKIKIVSSRIGNVTIDDIEANDIYLDDVDIDKNLKLTNSKLHDVSPPGDSRSAEESDEETNRPALNFDEYKHEFGNLDMDNTFIGSRLLIEDNYIYGTLQLDTSSAQDLTHVIPPEPEDKTENDETDSEGRDEEENEDEEGTGEPEEQISIGALSVHNFVTDRLKIDEPEIIYGDLHTLTRKGFLGNPPFNLLVREQKDKELTKQETHELTFEYSALKNWYARLGELKLEDQAYYNFRNVKQVDRTLRTIRNFFFRYFFGWGIRLTNILGSAAIWILLFASAYCFYPFEQNLVSQSSNLGVRMINSVTFSFQTFFDLTLGKAWSNVHSVSTFSIPIMLEGIIGIIYVTVFVGAYVRKMLR